MLLRLGQPRLLALQAQSLLAQKARPLCVRAAVAQEPSQQATLQGLQLKVSAVLQLLLALCLLLF